MLRMRLFIFTSHYKESTIGVNLGGFCWHFVKSLQDYKHAVPTGLKRVLTFSRFSRRSRFGWETEPTGLGITGNW